MLNKTRALEIGSPTVAHNGDTLLGWVIVIAGLLDVAVGAVLIWVRSRRKG